MGNFNVMGIMRTHPLLRASGFAWQEKHAAHVTAEGAMQETKDVLNYYKK